MRAAVLVPNVPGCRGGDCPQWDRGSGWGSRTLTSQNGSESPWTAHSGDPKPQERLGSAGGERSRGEGALLPLFDGVIEGGQEQ